MAINMIWYESKGWLNGALKKMEEDGLFLNLMPLSTHGLEEKSIGESFTLPAPATDSTTCTKPDARTSYTSVSLTITNGMPKLTPELEAAIDEQARIFASTISSLMGREMMTTCGYCAERNAPRTTLSEASLSVYLKVRYPSCDTAA